MTSKLPVRRWLAAIAGALLLAACASKEPASPAAAIPEPLPPPKPPEVSPQRRAELHTELGAGYYERGQMDIALDELNEAVKLDPGYARAYNIYGLVYAVLGETAKAEQSFQRALALAPQDPEIRQNWGFYLCTHGRAGESLAEFDTAIRNPLYKTPEIPLVNAGRCAASIGDFRLADSYFRRALALAANNDAALLGLAQIAYREARNEEARQMLKSMRQAILPPVALYLGMCVERRLGDRQAEVSYMTQLKNRYPDADESRKIATGYCE
jgi:type IV pilus assembly protein PilF